MVYFTSSIKYKVLVSTDLVLGSTISQSLPEVQFLELMPNVN